MEWLTSNCVADTGGLSAFTSTLGLGGWGRVCVWGGDGGGVDGVVDKSRRLSAANESWTFWWHVGNGVSRHSRTDNHCTWLVLDG